MDTLLTEIMAFTGTAGNCPMGGDAASIGRISRPLSALFRAAIVSSCLCHRATCGHAAPAARPVFADIEEKPTAGGACLNPVHRIGHQQGNRCFHDSEPQEGRASLFRGDFTRYRSLG